MNKKKTQEEIDEIMRVMHKNIENIWARIWVKIKNR